MVVTANQSPSGQSGPAYLSDPLRRSIKEKDIVECHGSERKIGQAKDLHTVIKDERFIGWGFDCLARYLQEDELSFNDKTARVRIRVAVLPIEPFLGTNFPWHKLLQFASLYKKGHDLWLLREQALSGAALPAVNGKRKLADKKPCVLRRMLAGAVRDVNRPLDALLAKDGLKQEEKEVPALDETMRGMVLSYLKGRGLTPAEFFAERRAVDREGPAEGKDTRVSSAEFPKEEAPLDPKIGGSETAAAAEPEAPQEPQEEWYVPVARAVVENLGEEEKLQLEQHLVLALMGRPPSTLVQFVRVVYDRIEGQVPQKIHDDLDEWLYIASRLDIKVRWNDIYNFWISAQLPGFLEDLHRFHAAELSPEQLQVMEGAWARWPEPEPEPPPVPEGVDPEMWHRLGYLPHWRKMAQLWEKIEAHPERQYNIHAMGRAWLALRKADDSLASLERLCLRILEEKQPPAAGMGT